MFSAPFFFFFFLFLCVWWNSKCIDREKKQNNNQKTTESKGKHTENQWANERVIEMKKRNERKKEIVEAEVVGNLKIAGAQFNVTSVC